MDEIGEDYGDKELQPGGGEDSNELLNDIVWLMVISKVVMELVWREERTMLLCSWLELFRSN